MKSIWIVSFGLLFVMMGNGFAQGNVHLPFQETDKIINSSGNARVQHHEDMFTLSYLLLWDTVASAWGDTVEREVRTYAPNGSLTTKEKENTAYLREKNWYNSDGLVEYSLTEQWMNNIWDTTGYLRNYYDAFDNLERAVIYSNTLALDSVWQWRWLYTYTGNNQIEEKIRQENSPTQDTVWANRSKTVYTFNPTFEWTSFTEYGWNNSTWEPNSRTIDLLYHDFSKRLALSGRRQNYTSGNWGDYERFATTYGQFDSDVTITEKFSSVWDTTLVEQTDLDAQGHLAFYKRDHWNWDSGGIVISSWYRVTNTYDTQGRLEEAVYERWQDHLHQYRNWLRLVIPSFFTGIFSQEEINSSVQAWPNPVTTELRLKLENAHGPTEINILDLQGRLRSRTLMHWRGEEIVVPLSDRLEEGAYIWQIIKGNERTEGKFLVRH